MLRYVLTGAPGTGKTSVLNSLAASYTVVPEPARQVIAEHRESTGETGFDERHDEFVGRLLERSIANYEEAETDRITIFDRGMPDCAAYALVSGVDPEAALDLSRRFRYERAVFLFPPWRRIYTTDDMRRATYEQVVVFHDAVVAVYESLGYTLVDVPLLPIGERVAFVAARIETAQST